MGGQAWVGFCIRGLVLKQGSVLKWEQSLSRVSGLFGLLTWGIISATTKEKGEISYHCMCLLWMVPH